MRRRIDDVLNLNANPHWDSHDPDLEESEEWSRDTQRVPNSQNQTYETQRVFLPENFGLKAWWRSLWQTQILPEGTVLEARRQLFIALIVVLCVFVLVASLALFSYDDFDPSFNTATWRDVPENWMGASGAGFADFSFQLFGYMAWLIPAFVLAWIVFGLLGIGHGKNAKHSGFWGWRLSLSPFAILCLAAALAWLAIRTGWNKPLYAGGAGGDLLLAGFSNLTALPEGLAAFVFLLVGLIGTYFCAALPARVLDVFPWAVTGLLSSFTLIGREAMRPQPHQAPSADPFAAEADQDQQAHSQEILHGDDWAQNNWSERGEERLSTQLDPVFLETDDVQDAEDWQETEETHDGQSQFNIEYDVPPEHSQDAGWATYQTPVTLTVSDQSLFPYGNAGEPSLEESAQGLDEEDLEIDPAYFADDEASAEPSDDQSPTLASAAQPATKLQKKVKPQPRPAAKGGLKARRALMYKAPSLDILAVPSPAEANRRQTREELEDNANLLTTVLAEFGVKGKITNIRPGPVVTLFELQPAPGTKTARVVNLADDIARSMSAFSARIATVPGRNVIGIELPNPEREMVMFREMLECQAYKRLTANLPIALGKDIGGSPVYVDLTKMPHLLVAGTTGSGKSVAINTMILSLLYSQSPEVCKFIMIDPKMLELSVYDGIPHLLSPVVTEPKKAVVALNWAVREMEERYKLMSNIGVRNIAGFNKRMETARTKGEILKRKVQTGFDVDTGSPVYEEQEIELKELPFIVVIIDEMADLMLVAGKEIEAALQRLAQMARAAGIHMVMATQRPSVDVITGTIKANFPTRISFSVTSKIDSRTILGEMGAEQLLGQGDMLYMPNGGRIQRVHGPFASDDEVEAVVSHLRDVGEPEYIEAIAEEPEEETPAAAAKPTGDDLYDQAVAVVLREKKASTSFVQRHLQIGYNRAARLIEQMEAEGLISKADKVGRREIYAGNQGEDVL